MQTVLIVVHLIIVLALVGVVLVQRSEGGGLGLGGGGGVSGFMTGRGQTNVLTRTTAILATLFFLTSLALSIMAGFQRTPTSIFTTPAGQAPAGGAPSAPAGGNVLDQLRQLQDRQGGGSAPQAPAAPSAPAQPQVPTQQ